MSIKKALKKLATKLTGSEFTGKSISDSIDYIADNYTSESGGGSSSGGPTVFKITGEWSEAAGQNVYTLADGKTFADISDSIYAGEVIFLCADMYPGQNQPKPVYPVASYAMNNEWTGISHVIFAATVLEVIGGSLVTHTYVNTIGYKINSDGTVETYSVSANVSGN